MSERIACFVLAGGAGTRLWPLSRPDKPKQFHDLSGSGSMLAQTLRRLRGRPQGQAPIFVVATERHATRVRLELAGMDLEGRILLEPEGRNTAASVALATLTALEAFGDCLVLVAPTDHQISTDAQFWETVERGVPAAQAGRLVLFGIRPRHAETGFGYVEAGARHGAVLDVKRFVEKPGLEAARRYLRDENFFWNAGIFLFRAQTMRRAFQSLQPAIWAAVQEALAASPGRPADPRLPVEVYRAIPSISIDHAIMERSDDLALVPAGFDLNDIGSWGSLLAAGPADENGNVVFGDVLAVDSRNSYLRSEGRLLSAVGLDGLTVIATPDAVFAAPAGRSQEARRLVEHLNGTGGKQTGIPDHPPQWGAWRERARRWLFGEAIPLWSRIGVDERQGGFHEAVGFDGRALAGRKRMRTMARQVYAFAAAGRHGWDGPAGRLIDHGLAFIAGHGRTPGGGWARTLDAEGMVLDATQDSYDHACVLLALAEAHQCDRPGAVELCQETLAVLDTHLRSSGSAGYLDTADADPAWRRSNPHMHLLEAFLAWHGATGDDGFLVRAEEILGLFASSFFDAGNWTLAECFNDGGMPATGVGEFEPGHHFEWAWLIVDFARRTGRPDLVAFARKLYATAVANGINRVTGLAFGRVSASGAPLDPVSRSWPQAEAIKAAIALDSAGGADLKPEIEERVGRLFAWHLDPAPAGLWIDRTGPDGEPLASEVPASILYHLVSALTAYLDYSADADQ